MNEAETKAFSDLVIKVEKLEKSLDITDTLLKACFSVALAAGGGSYKTLAEMRTLIANSGQKTDEFDTLISRISESFKNASSSMNNVFPNG